MPSRLSSPHAKWFADAGGRADKQIEELAFRPRLMNPTSVKPSVTRVSKVGSGTFAAPRPEPAGLPKCARQKLKSPASIVPLEFPSAPLPAGEAVWFNVSRHTT